MTQNHDPGSEELISEFIERERAPHREPRVRVTGLLVQSSTITSVNANSGLPRGESISTAAQRTSDAEHIDETSYRDNRRSFQINGRIALDMLDSGEVMEVKASSTLEKPARMQLLYYLWYLDRILDIQRDGVLAYPAERTREEVSLTEDNAAAVEETIRGIIDVVESDSPPTLDKTILLRFLFVPRHLLALIMTKPNHHVFTDGELSRSEDTHSESTPSMGRWNTYRSKVSTRCICTGRSISIPEHSACSTITEFLRTCSDGRTITKGHISRNGAISRETPSSKAGTRV